MRQTKIICDRCGKEIDYPQGIPVFIIARGNNKNILDMCDECRIELINFMHGGRVVDIDCIENMEAENETDN